MGKKKRNEPKVLYLRVTQDLLDGLEVIREQWCKKNKGVKFSREDIARSILWKAVEVEGGG